MIPRVTQLIALSALTLTGLSAAPASAESSDSFRSAGRGSVELPPYLQCVPYAREQSGVQIYGNAHEWWDKAEGRFKRGNRPKVGAVMAFQPHRNMRLGHVAAVSKVIDKRTVLLRHANWSPINGRRGQIENDVRAIDVSRANDWSQVRVWYHPIQALGKTAWPVHGFIYSDKAPNFGRAATVARSATPPAPRRVAPVPTVNRKPSKPFQNAFADLNTSVSPARASVRPAVSRPVARARPASRNSVDDFASIIAKYDR